MQIIRRNGTTSNCLRVKLRHATTGQGLTGLTSATSGLIISTICDNEAAATVYTVAGSTIETITTLATYAAPTATKCRFKLVDDTNNPGLVEIQLADARFAVSNAKVLRINISGAANLLDAEFIVQLDNDVTHLKGTDQTGRDIGASVLLSSGTGTGQLDFTSGVAKSNVTQFGGSAGTFASGRPDVNTTHFGGTLQTAGDIYARLKAFTRFKVITWIDTTDTAKTVIEAASAGTLCVLAPGTHAIGDNKISIPDVVSVWGCGRDVTTMATTHLSTTDYLLRPGNNTEVADFTFQSTNADPGNGGNYDLGFGCGVNGTPFSNAVARRMRFIGYTDVLYINNTSACTLTMDDCELFSAWDSVVVSGTGGAHVVTMKNVRIRSVKANALTSVGGMNVANSATLYGDRVNIVVQAGSSTSNMRGIYGTSGAVHLTNSTVTLIGTGSSINVSVAKDSPSVLTNCEFDRTKSSGTFDDKYTPHATYTRVGAPAGASVSADIAAAKADTAAILVDTGTDIPATLADGTNGLAAIKGAAGTIQASLTADQDEPTQGAPAANASALTKLAYLFKAWRNKSVQTDSEYRLYNSDGSTIDHKATFSDNGTTATRTDISTGA